MSLRSDDLPNWTPRKRLAEVGAEVERAFLAFVEDYSLAMLQYSMVVVYVWFGLLTVTGMSETAGLIADAFPFVPTGVFLTVLGGWEIAVGLALLSRRTVRLAAVLLAVHAAAVMPTLVLFPNETFTHFPYAPSFEGVYIIKDWVLLAGSMTVGGLIDESPK